MSSVDNVGAVIAAAAMGTAAVIVFALLPVISGTIAESYGLIDTQIGEISASYFSIYALVALSSGLWIRQWNWRHMSHIGFGGMTAGLLICIFGASFTNAKIGLAVTGLSAGILFPISLTLVSDMVKTERSFAIKLSTEQLVPAGLLFLFATTLFIGYSHVELIWAILCLVVVCWLASVKLPPIGAEFASESKSNSSVLVLALLSLVALSINFAGFAGLWAFMERLGNEQGFDASFINTWLGVGLITSGVGPLGAIFFEKRFGRMMPLLIASGASLLLMPLLAGEVSRADYITALVLIPLAYYFAITYMFAVVSDADHNGKMAGQMSFALAIGAVIGPSVFGLLKAQDGPVISMMALMIFIGASMHIYIQQQLNKRTANE